MLLRPIARLHDIQAEVYDGEMYVFGGICCQSSCGNECGAKSQVQIYNPEANLWRVGEPTPWQVLSRQRVNTIAV